MISEDADEDGLGVDATCISDEVFLSSVKSI